MSSRSPGGRSVVGLQDINEHSVVSNKVKVLLPIIRANYKDIPILY